MNELAPAVAEPARERGIALEALRVAHIREYAVERRVEARGARRQQGVRARVQHFRAVDRPGAAEIGVEIAVLRAAEGQRYHPLGRNGHVVGVEHAARFRWRARVWSHPA